MNIPLQNISNFKRDIYLFLRESNNSLKIQKVSDWFPFFYEPEPKGSFIGYDGVKLKKIYGSEPKDIPRMRTLASYAADIRFCSNFMANNINTILPSNYKYLFLDIEILAGDLPFYKDVKYPISSVSIYNSYNKNIYNWFLPEQKGNNLFSQEKNLIYNVISYIKQEQPDLCLGWNMDNFDYPYMFCRAKCFKIDLARELSPIYCGRLGENKDIFYPAGISIIDYLTFFKKVYMREASYALNYIGEKHLGRGKTYKNVDFSQLNETVKLRNQDDVRMLAELENKYNLLTYYDEIRRLSKVEWSDLYWNSRIVDGYLFQEAKLQNVILPSKQNIDKNNIEEGASFKGAMRGIESTGVFFGLSKSDLTSAYPSMITNFCLDPTNIVSEKDKDNTAININGIYFKQNPNALLPSIVKKILILKDKLKKEKKAKPNDKLLDTNYSAVKGIVNSFFGICASPFFRLFNLQVAESITFLVRDLLSYVKEKIEKNNGLKVIYYDTDSFMIDTKSNITPLLNDYIRAWAKEKYNKDNITLQFEFEGYFEKIMILGSCHYFGYINGKKEPEIKGVEVKRASSTKYEASFQETLINKVLNKEDKSIIIDWVNKEKERIKTLPLEEIAFPCKLHNKEYKNYPIFQRGYDNTKKIIKDFKVAAGEIFYYVYINQAEEVLAFSEHKKDFINRDLIDWNKVIERNIDNKVQNIFKALGWAYNKNNEVLSLF